MEWLKPFMTQRKYRQGDVLFKKGDAANEMFLTGQGAEQSHPPKMPR